MVELTITYLTIYRFFTFGSQGAINEFLGELQRFQNSSLKKAEKEECCLHTLHIKWQKHEMASARSTGWERVDIGSVCVLQIHPN